MNMQATSLQIMRAMATAVANAVAAACLVGCGIYSADPITAWVVDADTGAPLDNVHVVATWKVRGGLEGGNIVGYLKVMETVTDKTGRFHFPGWGPRPNIHFGGIENSAPSLLLLKRGYAYLPTSNNRLSVTDPAPWRFTSEWDGKTLSLKRLDPIEERKWQTFSDLEIDVGLLKSYGNHWGEIHDFACEMGLEVTRRLGQDHTYSLEDLEERYGVHCPR